jgi:hypothetical protein
MKKRLLVGFVMAILVLGLAACGGQPTSPAGNGEVTIVLETDPSPPTMGDIELIVLVTDAQGNPLEGAKVDVGADHTDMTGMGMHGPASEQGDGRYAIKANFSMTGNWKITVYVRQGELDIKQDIPIIIQ